MMHVPVDVPANGGLTVAFDARPVGSKVTDNEPVPAGLPATLQAATAGRRAVTDFLASEASKRSVALGVFALVTPLANIEAKSPDAGAAPPGMGAGAVAGASGAGSGVAAGAAVSVV